MANSIGRHIVREIRHDLGLRQMDNNDHATKKGGGTPTHGQEANYRTPERSETDKTVHPASGMGDVVKAATGGGAAPAGPGPSDFS